MPEDAEAKKAVDVIQKEEVLNSQMRYTEAFARNRRVQLLVDALKARGKLTTFCIFQYVLHSIIFIYFSCFKKEMQIEEWIF